MSRRLYSNILVAWGISLASLVGDAEANPWMYQRSKQEQGKPEQSRTEAEIMRILGLKERKEIAYLPEEYVTSRGIQAGLLTIAGVYGGEIAVKKSVKGNKIKYSLKKRRNVSQASPHFMKAVRNADVNGDKVVTSPEINDLKLRVYKKYAKWG